MADLTEHELNKQIKKETSERIWYIVGLTKQINARGTPLDALDMKKALERLRPWTEEEIVRATIPHLDLPPSADVKVPTRGNTPAVSIPTGDLMELILFFEDLGIAGTQTLVNDLYEATMTSKPDTLQPLSVQLRCWWERQVQTRPWMVIVEEGQDKWRRLGIKLRR